MLDETSGHLPKLVLLVWNSLLFYYPSPEAQQENSPGKQKGDILYKKTVTGKRPLDLIKSDCWRLILASAELKKMLSFFHKKRTAAFVPIGDTLGSF